MKSERIYMIRVVIIAGFVAACGFLGIIKAWELKERAVLLEDYRKMLLQLKSRINYFREPITTVLETEGEKGRSRAIMLLNEIGAELKEKNAEIDRIWSQNVDKIYKHTPLTSDDMEIIRYPGKFLGQTDCDNQQSGFIYMEEKLAAQIDEAEIICRVKGPLYRRLGFFAGGLAAIIFI